MNNINFDEPVVLQISDTLELPWTEERFLGLKLGCDKLDEGYGKFGSFTNPIPVNGAWGEYAYLNRLRLLSGAAVSYRRVCSRYSARLGASLDEYAIFGSCCCAIAVLYFHMYHLWRSTAAPNGFRLKPYSDLSEDELNNLKIGNLEMYT